MLTIFLVLYVLPATISLLLLLFYLLFDKPRRARDKMFLWIFPIPIVNIIFIYFVLKCVVEMRALRKTFGDWRHAHRR